MLMNIPVRLPTSQGSPISMMGLERRETYTPEQNLLNYELIPHPVKKGKMARPYITVTAISEDSE
jgi:hypothetical protein